MLGVLAGLVAAAKRFRVESHNRRVEIALEWQEVSQLAQSTGRPIPELLSAFRTPGRQYARASGGDADDAGAERSAASGTQSAAQWRRSPPMCPLASPELFQRIKAALTARNVALSPQRDGSQRHHPDRVSSCLLRNRPARAPEFFVPMDYAGLRTMGLGLPPEGVAAAQSAGAAHRRAHRQLSGRQREQR